MNFSETRDATEKGVNSAALSLRNFVNSSKVQKIVIIVVILLALLSFLSSNWFLENIGVSFIIPTYVKVFIWLLLILLFLVAVLIRYKELAAYSPTYVSLSDSSPIKGPLPFQSSDAELFKKLERNGEIQLFTNAISQKSYRIGVLTAVSGCGKSSLLNAGLLPTFKNLGQTCVIVNFTNKPAGDSVTEALKSELAISDLVETTDVYALLEKVVAKRSFQTLILVLDQFEQFFTQIPSSSEREPFIMQLKQICDNLPSVKILMSIRSDFLNYLHEVQEKLQYTLDVTRNYFTLKKFTIEQAVAVFMVIAEAEKIENRDISYLERITTEELASKEDGLISPVDLQIISLIIKSNKEKNTSYNERSFKQLGGVEGLLKRYIVEQLNVPNLFKKESVLNVLLILIDTNKGVKVGQLNADEIATRLVYEHKADLANILQWLEAIRLIHSIGSPPRYELAHERLILPILNILNDSNISLRKVDYLIERRSDEWIANNRNSRYLFSVKELLLINKYKRAITWGKNEKAKRQLLRQSVKAFRNWGFAIVSVVVFAVSLLLITNSRVFLLNYKIKNDILRYISIDQDDNNKLSAVDSLAGVDDNLAFKVVASITNAYPKSIALASIAVKTKGTTGDSIFNTAIKTADSISVEAYRNTAFKILSRMWSTKAPIEALGLVKKISDKDERYAAMDSIAQIVALKDVNQSLSIVSQIPDVLEKASAFRLLIHKINDPNVCLKVMKDADPEEADLDYFYYYFISKFADVQTKVAIELFDKLSDKNKDDKVNAFLHLIDVISLKNSTQALQLAHRISAAFYKSFAYATIASRIPEGKQSSEIFNLAIEEVKKISEINYRGYAYVSIADKMPNKNQSDSVFNLAVLEANNIEDKEKKDDTYSAIAEKLVTKHYERALEIVDKITDKHVKAYAYSSIATTLTGINLNLAYTIANKVDIDERMKFFFEELIEKIAAINYHLALNLVDRLSQEERSRSYFTIAKVIASSDPIAALEVADNGPKDMLKPEEVLQIYDLIDKGFVLKNEQERKMFLSKLGHKALKNKELLEVKIIIYQKLSRFKDAYNTISELDVNPNKKVRLYIKLYKYWKLKPN